MQVWSDELTIAFLGTYYFLGLIVYTLIAVTTVNGFKETDKQVKFFTTLIFSFLGGIIGTLLSLTIYKVFVPDDIIYGTVDYDAKFEQQWQPLKICVVIPICTTLLFSYLSFNRQLK